MGTPENIFPYSLTYIRLIFFGISATMLYSLLSGGCFYIYNFKV